MSNLSDAKSKVLGSIAAIQTLLERYPILITTDSLIGGNTSFGFMLNILKIIGVSEMDIIEWLSKLLAGKGTNSVLNIIEESVKAILLANVKNLLTCSINPILPDKLMYKYKDANGNEVKGEGIELDIDTIDLYGVLNNCPTSDDGSVFYFDTKESIYNDENSPKLPSYTLNEVWKSCDFNAYLWYVINKGTGVYPLSVKNYWDNRVKYIEAFKENNSLKERFFKTYGNVAIDNNDGGTINKKRIIFCEYVERNHNTSVSNVLKVWLDNDRYYHARKLKNIEFNRTVFEFNYDYIYSLKLFDSKTLVAHIVNAVLGISMNMSGRYSIYEDIIAGKVGSIVKKIIEEDDTLIDDCYYSFSNDEYNRLLEEAVRKRNGTYTFNNENIDIDYTSIYDSINDISEAATLNEEVKAISNVFTDIAATAAQNGSISSKDKFTFGLDIITELLEQTVTQIVMQILSPKVVMLFKINQIIMGDIDPQSDLWGKRWETFIKNFQNVIFQAIKEIKDIIVQQMYQWLIEQLTPLMELFVSKLLLETINDYRILLKQLINFCSMGFSLGTGTKADTYIDNANYADIVPTQVNPNKNNC